MKPFDQVAKLTDPYEDAIVMSTADGFSLAAGKIEQRIISRMEMAQMCASPITEADPLFSEQELAAILSVAAANTLRMVAQAAHDVTARFGDPFTTLVHAVPDNPLRSATANLLLQAEHQIPNQMPLLDERGYRIVLDNLIAAFNTTAIGA